MSRVRQLPYVFNRGKVNRDGCLQERIAVAFVPTFQFKTMDRLDTMLAFTRVVELNSFTKASISLKLPKTTVSAQVGALEQRLRVKLLHRTTRHISVTPDGAAYYERAVRLLSDFDEAEGAIAALTAAPKGRLRIGIPASLGRRMIIPRLPEFLARYPEIELDVSCTDRQTDLVQEGIDCVIRGGVSVDDSLVARRLKSYPVVTCASPAYLEQYGTPTQPDDLESHWIVHYISPRTGKAHAITFGSGKDRRQICGRQRISLNDSDGCIEAAVAGMGIVQLPEFLLREELARGRLVALMEKENCGHVNVSILYPRSRNPSARVRAFIEWAVELFA